MQLRPYQQRIIDDTRTAFAAGKTAPLIVMPTGAGKTNVMVAIAKNAVERGNKVVWLTHTQELAKQTIKSAQAQGLMAGAIGATLEHYANKAAPFQVCMTPTLIAREVLPKADLCLIDEAHRSIAEESKKIAENYARRIGATATPVRADGAPLGDLFDDIIVGPSMLELIRLGHLVPSEIIAPAKPKLPGEIAQSPVAAYKAHADGTKTIVFATTVKVAEQYAEEFKAEGIAADVVTAETPNRVLILKRHVEGKLRVLVNVGVLGVGYDDPTVETVILARGFGHVGYYLQVLGRALRPSPGKTRALIIDLRGSVHVHGPPEADRVYSLTGDGIALSGDVAPRHCPVCAKPLKPTDVECTRCGWKIEEQVAPRVTNDPLVKYAAKRAENDDARAMTLAKWLVDARVRGYRMGWAHSKYRAVYGAYPNSEIMAKARAFMPKG